MANIMIPVVTVQDGVALSSISGGQRLVVKILNADGSTAQSLIDSAIPDGKTLTGSLAYSGTLA